jgi:alanine-glyoxylate transaminase/serine-glyoxylate transaminase/serine-pyruvate transaminase
MFINNRNTKIEKIKLIMSNLLDGIEEILLMGPGPSCVHDTVYEALSKKSLGHLDPYFIRIMDAIKKDLRFLLNTDNTLTIPMSGTGSSGMAVLST